MIDEVEMCCIPVKPLCANSIDFIYKNDAGRFLFCKQEGISDKFGSISNEHLKIIKVNNTCTRLLSYENLNKGRNIAFCNYPFFSNLTSHDVPISASQNIFQVTVQKQGAPNLVLVTKGKSRVLERE